MPVWIDDTLLVDGQLRPFAVGDELALHLTFVERFDASKHGTVTVEGHAAPGRAWTDPEGQQRWSTDLVGEGWDAVWEADRRVEGQVELTGEFRALLDPHKWDFYAPTTGTVWRIKVLYRPVIAGPEREGHWSFAPGPGQWRHLERSASICPFPLHDNPDGQAVAMIVELLVPEGRA